MEFIERKVHFSPHDMLIMVDDNIDPYYKNLLPEVALMPFSYSISESDPRVVGVVMESERVEKLNRIADGVVETVTNSVYSGELKWKPSSLFEEVQPKILNKKSEIKWDEEVIIKRFHVPVAFFKVNKMDDLMYINNYIKTIQLFSDYGMEFPDELKVAKRHYNMIKKQCNLQEGITNFKVITQIYDVVFV